MKIWIYETLLLAPIWLAAAIVAISILPVLFTLRKKLRTDIFNDHRKKQISKTLTVGLTIFATLTLSFFSSLHLSYSKIAEKAKNQKSPEKFSEFTNFLSRAKKPNIDQNLVDDIRKISEISNLNRSIASPEKTPADLIIESKKDFNEILTISKKLISQAEANPESLTISDFLVNYIYQAFLSLALVGAFISAAYAWLNKEYRRFNDHYVEYTSKYIALNSKNPMSFGDVENIALEKKELLNKLSFLLREEYIMFFQMNTAYSQVKFKYFFQPYFYILNICYAFGLDLYIDGWAKAFESIVLKETNAKGKIIQTKYKDMHEKLYEISELENEREKLNLAKKTDSAEKIGEFEKYLITLEDQAKTDPKKRVRLRNINLTSQGMAS